MLVPGFTCLTSNNSNLANNMPWRMAVLPSLLLLLLWRCFVISVILYPILFAIIPRWRPPHYLLSRSIPVCLPHLVCPHKVGAWGKHGGCDSGWGKGAGEPSMLSGGIKEENAGHASAPSSAACTDSFVRINRHLCTHDLCNHHWQWCFYSRSLSAQ